MPPTNPHGTRNKKHPRQDETSDQLPAPKRHANSRQPSHQGSLSVTIQDDDVVIEATPLRVTPPPLPTIELQRCLDTNEARDSSRRLRPQCRDVVRATGLPTRGNPRPPHWPTRTRQPP